MAKSDQFRKAAPNVTDVRILTIDGIELPAEDEKDLHNYIRDLDANLAGELEDFLIQRSNAGATKIRIITGRGGTRSIFSAVGKILGDLKSRGDLVETYSPEQRSANGSYIVILKD